MKKFLEALSKAGDVYSDAPSEAPDNSALRKKYSSYIGKRALYTSKVSKECRIVRIVSVTDDCVILSYPYYTEREIKVVNTSCTLNSLYCGEDILEVEVD